MAEMMAALAIVIILLSVIFAGILRYQRSLAQKQRDAIAKEIFIAAQNHLTMSRGEGYTGVTGMGTAEEKTDSGSDDTSVSKDPDIYYYVVSDGSAFTKQGTEMIDVMLPFGSVEETVRTGGSYVVRYEPETATIYDVFYCTLGSDSRFDFDLSTVSDYKTDILGYKGDYNKDRRRNYMDGAVLGWYGGADLESLPYDLETPQVSVSNGDKLLALITNNNFTNQRYTTDGLQLKLIITGLQSGAKMAILIDDPKNQAHRLTRNGINCTFVLDSVTENKSHFSDLTQGVNYMNHQFLPGEDISVEAVAYSKSKLCKIRFSEAKTDNSLFESLLTETAKTTAFVSSFRHLENLDSAVSNLGRVSNPAAGISTGGTDPDKEGPASSIIVTDAKQTEDLVWGREDSVFDDDCRIYDLTRATAKYRPVTPEFKIEYNGLDHSIEKVTANYNGHAGIFGAPPVSSKFSNLELIDCDIKANGGNNAGTLAGVLDGVTTGVIVHNVVAHNSDEDEYEDRKVESVSGVAGGLVGEVKGGKIEYSAASVKVEGKNAAGGLVGLVDGNDLTTIEGCYSGGHTNKGEYYEHKNDGSRDDPIYNVEADNKGAAGGLVGNAAGATISYSYSTCSANGSSTETGGFVGKASGTISHCYSLGLAGGTDDNGFIGSGRIKGSESYYLEMVNEYLEDFTEVPGTKVINYKNSGSTRVAAMDESIEKFREFKGYTKNSAPYDEYLEEHYPGSDNKVKFPFKTVTQLNTQIPNADKLFVNSHYGDWPSPEIFIINN